MGEPGKTMTTDAYIAALEAEIAQLKAKRAVELAPEVVRLKKALEKVEAENAALRADYERCPSNGLRSHAWNHLNSDWIACSLCNARLPSREALSRAKGGK